MTRPLAGPPGAGAGGPPRTPFAHALWVVPEPPTGPLALGLLFGLAGGVVAGGFACLSHTALRLVLWRRGALPLDCAPFLAAAAERGLLRTAGGGFPFVHRLLQEHFATLHDAEETPS